MSALRSVAIGVRAAWRTPGTIAGGLRPLIAPIARSSARASATHDAPLAQRAAHAAIARFARVAPSRWRNTCLYRSVAECLALRALGLPARVVIGVGTGTTDEVIAHAWVECDGIVSLATRGDAELETMAESGRRVSSSGAGAR